MSSNVLQLADDNDETSSNVTLLHFLLHIFVPFVTHQEPTYIISRRFKRKDLLIFKNIFNE